MFSLQAASCTGRPPSVLLMLQKASGQRPLSHNPVGRGGTVLGTHLSLPCTGLGALCEGVCQHVVILTFLVTRCPGPVATKASRSDPPYPSAGLGWSAPSAPAQHSQAESRDVCLRPLSLSLLLCPYCHPGPLQAAEKQSANVDIL